jgi:hypothetical protein
VLRVSGRDLGNIGTGEIAGVPPLQILERDKILLRSPAEATLLVIAQDIIDELMFDFEELAIAMYKWAGQQESRWQEVANEMVS